MKTRRLTEAAQHPTKAFFVCPKCGSRTWGTSNMPRKFSERAWDRADGHCKECSFTWKRAADWQVFVRGFGSKWEFRLWQRS